MQKKRHSNYAPHLRGKIFKFDNFYVIQGHGFEGHNIITIQYSPKVSSSSSVTPRITYGYNENNPTELSSFKASYEITPGGYDQVYYLDGKEGIVSRANTSQRLTAFFENNPDASLIEALRTIGKETIPISHVKTINNLGDLINLRKGEPQDKSVATQIQNEMLQNLIETREKQGYWLRRNIQEQDSTITALTEQISVLSEENKELQAQNTEQKNIIEKFQSILASRLKFANTIKKSPLGEFFFKKPLRELNMDGTALPEGPNSDPGEGR